MDGDAQKSNSLVFASALGVAFLAGAVASYILIDLTAPKPAAQTPGAALTSQAAQAVAPPDPAAKAAAEGELVRLYEGINKQFVEQLREYSARMSEIADVAEAEGAATAAEQMREFGAETDDLIKRYDKIAKN